MKEKIRIADIAQELGVSVSTVSLVLNNRPGVSEETRDRVLAAAQKYNYPAKPANSSNKNRLLNTIGMIVKTDPDLLPMANPFYSKVIAGIEESCRRNGINLLFAMLPVDENSRPVDIPNLLYEDIADGLLMVGTFVDETILSLASKKRSPIVLVDGYSKTDNYDSVVSDNFHAAYQAVEYLIAKGHRHIGLIGSEACCYPSLRDRRNGYLRALKEHNINQSYVANFNLLHSKGHDETIRLLGENPQITSLFCINDDVAATAIRAIQSMGKSVPEDISVVGYDDTYLATNSHPCLTTMHVDTTAMGQAAVSLLSLRVSNPEFARMTLTVNPYLVERQSVSVLQTSKMVVLN